MRKADAVRKNIGKLKVVSEWLEADGKAKSSEAIDIAIIHLTELEKIYESEQLLGTGIRNGGKE